MDCCGVAYIIQPGDTLTKIAQKYLGSAGAWRRIMVFNNDEAVLAHGGARITNPDSIRAGDTIRLPIDGTAPGAGSTTTASATNPKQPQQSLMLQRPLRAEIFAFLNVYWNLLDGLPLTLIVGAVMKHVKSAQNIGHLRTEQFVLAWLVSIERKIATQGFSIDIPDLNQPKTISFQGITFKWAPVVPDITSTAFLTQSTPPRRLTAKAAFGELSVIHEDLKKIQNVGLNVPVSKAVTLGANISPWSSIGFTGKWKTKGSFPDFEVGSTLQTANFSDYQGATFQFAIKDIKLLEDLKLDASTSGPFDNLQGQSFIIKLKYVPKHR